MRQTMAFSLFKRSLFLVLHTKDNPTDEEWTEYIKFTEQNMKQITSTMILTEGGGPNATQRGLLNDTLVIWMGEFGRTPNINQRGAQPGRDHYPRAWSSVMLGGGLPGGRVVGRTDANGAVVQDRPVSTLDFMASVCRVLGIDHTKLTFRSQGRDYRLTDVHGEVVKAILA